MSLGNGTTTMEPFIVTTPSPQAIEIANRVSFFFS